MLFLVIYLHGIKVKEDNDTKKMCARENWRGKAAPTRVKQDRKEKE